MSKNDGGKRENKLFSAIKSNSTLKFVLIGVLCIVLIVIIFSGTFESNESVESDNSITGYVSSLENKLAQTLSQVEGAGDVSVVISVKSGAESVLAMKTSTKQTANGTEVEETPVIVNGKTVVLKELVPEITGVLIVAQGANNIMVKSRLQNATQSLLDIKLDKIEILTMN